MALADLAHAHHEPQVAVGQPDWSGAGTIDGLQSAAASTRVLVGERRAEEQPRGDGQLAPGASRLARRSAWRSERAVEVPVASAEAAVDRRARPRPRRRRAPGRGRRCPTPALAPAVDRVAGHEQLGDDAGRVRDEPERAAVATRRSSAGAVRAPAPLQVEISASVDSAPWLRLTPSACKPS